MFIICRCWRGEELLAPHRREITVVFCDLRGFTAFTDRADPSDVVERTRTHYTICPSRCKTTAPTKRRLARWPLMLRAFTR